jgi:hypothetical protein
MAVAHASGGVRIVIVQAGASAILTVAVAGGEAGTNRLEDALIGAGVALAFSQILFSPEPVAFVRRAETAALAGMADALEVTAKALERDDEMVAEQAMTTLRDHLGELGRTRSAGTRVARHSLLWWSRMTAVVRETENAGQLDLLGVSCLVLMRTAVTTSPHERRTLAPTVRDLAGVLGDLAKQPGDHSTRQSAVDHALHIVHRLAGNGTSSETMLAAIMAVRMVTADIMVFAGVESG